MKMKYNETELISFFEVLPQPESKGEKEFFGTIAFSLIEEQNKFDFSFSANHDDVYITVTNQKTNKPILELIYKNIVHVKVLKDVKKEYLVLLQKKDNNIKEVVEIYKKPIVVKVQNNS